MVLLPRGERSHGPRQAVRLLALGATKEKSTIGELAAAKLHLLTWLHGPLSLAFAPRMNIAGAKLDVLVL
jgi:hypothetical protein